MNEETPPATVVIRASIIEKITFASQQNDVAILADVVIANPTSESLEGLVLELSCTPSLVSGKTWQIDRLSAGSELRIRDRQVPMSGALLAELNERLKAKMKLVLRQGDKTLAEHETDITGLARNEWGGAGYMPELLAAFVMPNDPAITTILKEAGEVLRRAGEQPALDGYQSRSRMRVWQIASAIWTAVSARRLVYAEPPASFETQGQKIRTPSDVLNGGLATCLDTAVLYAAALEQAGLYPVIAMTKGHALCGVWLQPQQLPALTAEDCTDIRKYIALKEFALFETTMVVSEPPSSFSKAATDGERRVSEALEAEFVYALDIKQARRRQITPLGTTQPGSLAAGAGQGAVGTVSLGLESPPPLPAFDLGVGDGEAPDTPETRLDKWRRKLLDLTKRNRLLNLKPTKTAIRLQCSSPAVLEDKLAADKKITVITMAKMTGEKGGRDEGLFHGRTGEDFKEKFIAEALEKDQIVADMTQADLDAGLVQLYRKARTDLEEGGANTLYLALGMLKWKLSPQESQSYRAPLILVPVKLERTSAASKIKIVQHEDDTVFNMTLLEMLRQDFELRIPQLEGALPEDHSGVDVPLIWETVRKAVRDMPGFEVVEEVVLSTFSFAKYLMWKDLADRTEALKKNAFVKHLIDRPKESYKGSAAFLPVDQIDEKIRPAELFMPLPADGSQVVAVHASGKAGDFVLEGPPGTGKSQTIANIIAHNLALGKKVLFVAEKMTALEVVHDRLRERGLEDFCLELHSSKANKRDVLAQLGKSWRNRKAKTAVEWSAEATKLEKARDGLNRLVHALHDPGPSGVSPRAAIGRVARYGDENRIRLDWTGDLNADRIKSPTALEEYAEAVKKLGQSFAELSGREIDSFKEIGQTDWSNAWQGNVVGLAQQLIHAVDKACDSASAFRAVVSLPSQKNTFGHIRDLSAFAEKLPLAAENNLSFSFGDDAAILKTIADLIALMKEYRQEKSKLSGNVADDLLPVAPIAEWQQAFDKSKQAPWPFKPLQQMLLVRQMRKSLSLSNPNLENDLPLLRQLQELRQKIDTLAPKMPEGIGWEGISSDPEKMESLLAAGKSLREAITALAETPAELVQLRGKLKELCVSARDMIRPGTPIARSAADAVATIRAMEGIYTQYASSTSANINPNADLRQTQEKLRGIIDLQPRLNAWCRWQSARKKAVELDLLSLVGALESGAVEPENCVDSFRTAYCDWLARRLIDSRPELQQFSAVTHEDLIDEFRRLDQRLSDVSAEYIRAKLSGDVPDFESPDRAPGYKVLNHELQKKMRHKPVRKLVEEIGDILTTLTPCLLMSPLSISQFLSTDAQLFDLVVFDEASQITVWDAIGAVARGKNVIVVGDPKQMPPTNFFDRSANDDDADSDEDTGTEDLESILDEGLAAGVRIHRLTGHYRSRHESLIAFSNHRYYDSELITYPASETKLSAVSLRNVKGIYQRGKGRTNPIEAKAVVAEILRRLKDPTLRDFSIGVVTFNSEQKKLIEDLIDEARSEDPELEAFFESGQLKEHVVVKNLETVQGHEKDVVLLSIGYGPDTPEAKTMPMSFGPLNRKGGERRLNVAITRAKSEMIIFSSFEPGMIDLARTSAKAVRDLRHYMEFAQRGPVALAGAINAVGLDNQHDSDFERAVAEGLRKIGWTVHTQIGVSKFRIDLGVLHPDQSSRYLAGIECDGAAYHSSPSARDRDRVRQSILENLGWRIVRIWSTDYFVDSQTALRKTHERLQKILEEDREQAKKTAAQSAKQAENDDAPQAESEQSTEIPDATASTTGFKTQKDLSPDRFYNKDYLPVLQRYCCEIVDTLGPITFKHLCDKVSRAHGFQRTGPQIKSILWSAVAKNRESARTADGQTLLWPEGYSHQSSFAYRGLTINGHKRDWKDVPYPEKLQLAQSVLSEARDANATTLLASRIGFTRLHESTKEELEALLRAANDLEIPSPKTA